MSISEMMALGSDFASAIYLTCTFRALILPIGPGALYMLGGRPFFNFEFTRLARALDVLIKPPPSSPPPFALRRPRQIEATPWPPND